MFKSLVIALLGVAVVSVSSVEAQLFRRFIGPRPNFVQPAQQNYRNVPSGRYAVQPQPTRTRLVQPQQTQPQASQGQTYFRRVQVSPGRFSLVPVQPNVASQGQRSQATANSAASPQDIARQSIQQGSGVRPKTPSLEGPQASSVLTAQFRPAPVTQRQVQQTPQRYRRVTVYNTRTGQRSTRLIPIPSSTLAQQPHVYGQPSALQPAQTARVVTGTLVPPAQAQVSNNLANEIRLDAQVQPATFEEPTVALAPPKAVLVTSAAPEPQPAIATTNSQPVAASNVSAGSSDRQFSVLDFGDEASDSSGSEIGLELAAPAN